MQPLHTVNIALYNPAHSLVQTNVTCLYHCVLNFDKIIHTDININLNDRTAQYINSHQCRCYLIDDLLKMERIDQLQKSNLDL